MLDNLPADNYADETKPLFKMLRTEAFRFIVVSYNHYDLVRQLEQDLRARFPDRPFYKINAQEVEYRTISNSYTALGKGFYWIENFDDILRADRDSQGVETPEMALNNERRRHIAGGLNLRRDRWALSPIAMFVLVPTSAGPFYLRSIMEKMPDLWSFRSFVLELHRDYAPAEQPKQIEPNRTEAPQELDKKTKAVVQKELHRLQIQLKNIPADEHAYLLTLYPQIVDAQRELGAYQAALDILHAWDVLAPEPEKATIAFKKGELYTIIGSLSGALMAFKDALDRYSLQKDQLHIARCYRKIGDTYSTLGDLDQALGFFEEYNRLKKELYSAYPNNVDFKNGLAISYEKLGSTHRSLGNLDQALGFFEEETKLFKELYTAYPNNVSFKNGLAISYEKLGDTHSSLGNLDHALGFFEERNKLSKELYTAYPNNVEFKNGLAISFEKLGTTQGALGNLNAALPHFQQYNQLEKELHEAFPQNVAFKNVLAISYSQLGRFYRDKKVDSQKAKEFLLLCHQLWKELSEEFPEYREFKNYFDWARQALVDLDK